MIARQSSNCHYCGQRIQQGMKIDKAGFRYRPGLGQPERVVTEWVHETCARHARGEWPELNEGR